MSKKKNEKTINIKKNKINNLTPKHKIFCDKYIEFAGNASKAYMAVGYKANNATARVKAHHLLQKPEIKQYIDKRRKELENERTASIQEVRELWTNVLRNLEEKTKNRLKASEYLGKSLGMFKEQEQEKKDDEKSLVDVNININNGATLEDVLENVEPGQKENIILSFLEIVERAEKGVGREEKGDSIKESP